MQNKVLVGWLLFCLFVSTAFCGEPDKELELRCLRPTVQVTNLRGGGTGTIIKSCKVSDKEYLNAVLTCKHVTDCMPDEIYIATIGYKDFSIVDLNSSQLYQAYIYIENPDQDMAIVLFTSNKQMPVANLGLDENLYISNDIVSFGCAFRQFPRYDLGKITGVSESSYRAQLNAIPGDSGGGVFHHNKLIAIKMAYSLTAAGDGFPLHVINVSNLVSIKELPLWANKDTRVKETYDEISGMSELSFYMAQGTQYKDPLSLLLNLFH